VTVAYASDEDLTAWLPAGTTVDDTDRLLTRATELVDDYVTATFTVDAETSLPTDEDVAAALRDAVCAQVEYGLGVGEEHDIEGMAGRQVSIQSLSIGALPSELAPRAARALRGAGLFTSGVDTSPAGSFFGCTTSSQGCC
jgi:hypothetical protein